MVQTGLSLIGGFFQSYIVTDFLIPFFLVYAIVFAALRKANVLGTNRKIHLTVALLLALAFVIPHLNGSYPLGYDPVDVMNNSLPSIALVAVAALSVLILMGMFGAEFSRAAAPVVALISIAFIIWIFGSALEIWTGPYDTWSWWTPAVTEVMLIIIVAGLLLWLIVREPNREKQRGALSQIGKEIGNLFKKE